MGATQAPKDLPPTARNQDIGSAQEVSDADRLEADSSDQRSGLSMAMRIGTEWVVATMIGIGTGYWLDSQFGTEPWLLILFLIFGVAAGFKNVYRIVQPVVTEDPVDKN